MSYTAASVSNAERAKAITTVIGIHALIGAGLVAGLAVKTFVIDDDDGPIITNDVIVEIDPPEPVPTEIVDEPITQPRNDPYVPDTPIPRPDTNPITTTNTPSDPGPIVFNPGTELGPTPSPGPSATPSPTSTPAPTISAVAARPTNGPVGWITTDDYPPRDLRRGNEGTGSYRLTIGTNGRVSDCRMTASTGHRSLDRQTCRVIQRRARFNAATDNTGATVSGTYNGTVTWQIPE